MIYSIHQEVRRFAPFQLGADGRLYRPQVRGPICVEWGCKRIGFPCYLPDDPDTPAEYRCWRHLEDSGFCFGCGQFWAGIESFDSRRSQLCDNCASEVEYEVEDDDWGEGFFGPYCEHCGAELERVLCDQCGGEGYIDGERLIEEDPLWYDIDDSETCSECGGKGGWWWCPNEQCPGKKESNPEYAPASESEF